MNYIISLYVQFVVYFQLTLPIINYNYNSSENKFFLPPFDESLVDISCAVFNATFSF